MLAGSLLMLLGALAISTAVASSREHVSRNAVLQRECDRYGMDYWEVLATQSGEEFGNRNERRRWWDVLIVLAALSVFVWFGLQAVIPSIAMNMAWVVALSILLVGSMLWAGWTLWRHTRFN